jgi:RimJ/RimL family protein N-acetyltransferase
MAKTISLNYLPLNRPTSTRLLALYCQWFSDPDVTRYLSSNLPSTPAAVYCWLQSLAPPDSYYFLVNQSSSFSPLGHVGLKLINWQKLTAQVAVVIGAKNYWNQGIATKSLVFIIKYARHLGLKQLKALVHPNNLASNRLFHSLGFSPSRFVTSSLLVYSYHLQKEVQLPLPT